jgi:multisubunit Na+/H+ antiporter MnhG subunit
MIASRKKEMILIIVGLSASVVGAFGLMLLPGFVEIAMDSTSLSTLFPKP